MSNLIQESVAPQKPEELFDSRFSMLCLNASTVDGGGHPLPCASCGCPQPRSAATPLKRRSPTPFQDPNPNTNSNAKRLFLDDDQQPFSKIHLPIPFGPSASAPAQPTSSSPLRRTVSDPTEARNSSPSPAKRLCPNSALPPLPLRRTVSDPNPSADDNIPESPIKIGRPNDLIKQHTPDSKRLRRIKDRLKEMNHWWNEMMREQDREEDAGDENDTKKDRNGCCKEEDEEEDEEETVGVERVGDSLELQLKCPCGKRFQILLSGNSCFYKLI